MKIHLASLAIAVLVAVWPALGKSDQAPEISIEATIDRDGDFMGFGFDSLWMMSGGKLVRINAKDNSVTDISIEGAVGRYAAMAIGDDAIWVPSVGSKTIYKIDPKTNQMVLSIPVELVDSEGSIGVGNGAVWAVTGFGFEQVLLRLNAETGAEEARIQLPSPSSGVIADFGSVWVTGTAGNELYRIDPKTNQIATTTPLHQQPRFLTSGEGSVWVLNQGDGTVQRIDGQSGELLATIDASAVGQGGDIAVGEARFG